MTEQEKKYVESLKSALESADKRAADARLEANAASTRCFALERRLAELVKPVDFPDANGNMPDVLDITPMDCLTRAAQLADYLNQVIAKNEERESFLSHELGNARLENRMLKQALKSAGVCLEDYAQTLSGVYQGTESAPRPASARKTRKRKES